MSQRSADDPRWRRRSFLAAAATAPVVGLGASAGAGSIAGASVSTPGALAAMPTIVARREWGADLVPRGPIPAEDVRFLIVHHTLEPGSDYRAADVPRLLRGIFSYHTGADKAWPDIAYNFFVDKFGNIYEGRTGSIEGPVQGSATGGNQGFTQLCCFLGDYSVDVPPAPALDAMYRLLAWLADRYQVDTSPGATVEVVSRGSNRWKAGVTITAPTIAAHREMSQTECPGDACFALVKSAFPVEVSSLRAGAVAGATESSPTTVTSSTALPESSTAPAPTAAPTAVPAEAADAAASTTLAPSDDRTSADGATAGQVEVVEGGSSLVSWAVGVGGLGVIGGGAAVVARRNRIAGDRREAAPLVAAPADAAVERPPPAPTLRPLHRLALPSGVLIWQLGGPDWAPGATAEIEAGLVDALSGLATSPGWAQRPARLLSRAAAVIERSAPRSEGAGAWLIGRDGTDVVILLVGAARGLLENDDGGSARVPPGPSAVSLVSARLLLRSAPDAPHHLIDAVDEVAIIREQT